MLCSLNPISRLIRDRRHLGVMVPSAPRHDRDVALTVHALVSASCTALCRARLWSPMFSRRHRPSLRLRRSLHLADVEWKRLQNTTVFATLSMKLLPLAATLLFALSASSTAHAWGAEGHRLIADLADVQLTAVARAEVARLLAAEPGATMASVSTWADEIRSRETASWHYVNPPRGSCSYDRVRDCEDGHCAVDALDKQIAVLKSKSADGERLRALKWVIHLVGDIHQPLHAGFKVDKGGNLYQVQAYGRGTNLHALWDGILIRKRPGGLDALRASATTAGIATPLPPQSPPASE